MIYFLKTLRHYIDYIAGILLFIMPIAIGFFFANSYLDPDIYDLETRAWVNASVTFGLYGLIGYFIQAMCDTTKDLYPETINKFSIKIFTPDKEEEIKCKEYKLDRFSDHIDLTIDGEKGTFPSSTSIIITKI